MRLQKETNLYKDGAIGDGINDAIQTYDSYFDQTRVFNLLTKNGTAQGIFMVGDQLYINMNYLQTGTLVLGGANNVNGLMIVKDASGTEIGRWDNTGLTASGRFSMTENISSVQTMLSNLSSVTYYNYSAVSGQMYTSEEYGFQVERSNSGTVKCQYSITESNGGSIRENIYAVDGWTKSVFVGTTAGSGHYLLEYYNNLGFTLDTFNTSSPSTTWPAFQLNIRNAYIYVGGSGSTGRIYINGSASNELISSNDCYINLQQTSSGAATIQVNSNISLIYSSSYWSIRGANQTGNIAVQGSSSIRYKHDVSDKLDDELDPHRLYNLPVKQFVFNEDHELQYHDMRDKTLPGFIAEDVECYYPSATIHDGNGNVENWDERRIIPGMLKLIQEQHEEIERLKSVIHIS